MIAEDVADSVPVRAKWKARLAKLIGTDMASDSAILAIGTVAAQAILLAATPVLSRMYGPAAFGSAAKVLALVAALSVVATGRFELAIMLPASRTGGFSVFYLSVLFACAASLLAAGICAVLSPWFRLGDIAWALPMGLMINGISVASTYWLLRNRSFVQVAIGRLTSSLVTAGAQILIALTGTRIAPVLILTTLIGPAAMIVLACTHGSALSRTDRPSWSSIRSMAYEYRRFPMVEAIGASFGGFGPQLPVLLLSAWYPASRIGAFFIAQRLLTAPVSLIGSAVGQVFFQRASEREHQGLELWSISISIFRRLALIGLVPLLVIVIFGQPLLTWLLGRSWSDAGRFAQMLAIGTFFQLTFTPLSTLFAVKQRQVSALAAHLLIFSTPLIALFVGRRLFGDSPIAVVGVLGGASGLLYLALAMWNLYLARLPARPTEIDA